MSWNLVAWILQALLALLFLFHFVLYVFPPEGMVRRMRERGEWPPAIPDGFRRFIGIAELFGAIGLVLPAATRVLPWLTPVAALCLAFVTLSATVYHLRRREPPIALLVAVLCLAVAYLRWRVVPV